ncbi:MAG: hypothetical protein WC069_00970 [Candidatus Shapirobacteria bacterium]
MKIAWSVKIPKDSKLKIKDGSVVALGDVVYEYRQNIVKRLPLLGWQKLSSGDRKTILQSIVKRKLELGEVLKNSTWFSTIIVKSPGNGMCLGIDEFGNIELETTKDETYFAPISSKKIRIEEDKIVFELKGNEFESEGVNQIKSWGNFDSKIIDDMDQVKNIAYGQMVIIDSSLDAATKAEAVGANGLILVNFDKAKEFEDSDIPVVMMKKEEVEKLNKFVDGRPSKIWLNASTGKVLAVIE